MIGKRSLLLALLVLLLLALSGYGLLRMSLLPAHDRLTGLALSQPVSVSFDAQARPYVQAQSLDDALFTEGLLHASNRLWQMELLRLAGRADLHLLMGREAVDTDAELWRVGVPQLAQTLAGNIDPGLQELLQHYVDGINTGLSRYSVWPPELLLLGYSPAPWTLDDVFAVGAIIAFQSGNNYRQELLRLGINNQLADDALMALFADEFSDRPDYPYVLKNRSGQATSGDGQAGTGEPAVATAQALARAHYLDPGQNPLMPRGAFGSNGWVLAPAKSASGKALFAFDSHDALGLPNLFYELHMFYGVRDQIRGWSVPGLPGVINGYNQSIAWGFTNIGDTQDLFVETPHPSRANTFLYEGEWYRARTEKRVLQLPNGETHTLTRTLTRHGPLISDNPPISLAWTAHQPGEKGIGALLAINRAQNWTEFNRAADQLLAPTLNATYADIDGHIGFRTLGVLPLRGRGDGRVPLDGSDSANDWQGWVSTREMPRSFDPQAGYLAAANGRVSGPGEGPLVSADNAAPYRIARLQQLLTAAGSVTLDQMAGWQMDWHDAQAAWLLPHLLPHLEARHARWRDRFARWLAQPLAARDSAEALVFQQWYLDLAEALFKDPLGPEYAALLKQNYVLNQALDQLIVSGRHAQWWRGERSKIINAALAQSLSKLHQRLGDDESHWRLDQLQRVAAPHELGRALPVLGWLLNARAAAWGGSPASVGRANYRYHKPFQVSMGATVRVVAEMGPTIEARAVIPGGQSGHPLSGHYADQWPLWLTGTQTSIATNPGSLTPSLFLEPAQ